MNLNEFTEKLEKAFLIMKDERESLGDNMSLSFIDYIRGYMAAVHTLIVGIQSDEIADMDTHELAEYLWGEEIEREDD